MLPSLLYTRSAQQSPLSIGALSLKGDYPHPMAYRLSVYTSLTSLPNQRKTRYKALITQATLAGLATYC
jgi:hypothetical protein